MMVTHKVAKALLTGERLSYQASMLSQNPALDRHTRATLRSLSDEFEALFYELRGELPEGEIPKDASGAIA